MLLKVRHLAIGTYVNKQKRTKKEWAIGKVLLQIGNHRNADVIKAQEKVLIFGYYCFLFLFLLDHNIYKIKTEDQQNMYDH